MIVSAEFIEEKKSIDLFLGNKKVLQLELIPWDGLSIVDESDFFPSTVQPLNSEFYQIKLPYIANNMTVDAQSSQAVDYFNFIMLKEN